MTPPIRVTIAVVSWNTKDLTLQCLGTLKVGAGDVPFEAVVVDNASSDGTAEAVRSCYPDARVIEMGENKGYSAAVNAAFKGSQGEFLLLLNSDTLLHENALKKLVIFMDSHPEAGCAAPQLLNKDGTYQPSTNRFFPSPLTLLLNKVFFFFSIKQRLRETLFRRRKEHRTHPVRIAWAGGSALLFRRKSLSVVEGFDETYFLYGEETDCLRRLTEAGRPVWYVPEARVVHLGGASALQVSDRTYFEIRRSELIYFRKFYGSFGFWWARRLLIIEARLRYSFGRFPRLFLRRERRRKRVAVILYVLRMCRTRDLETRPDFL